MIVASCSSDTKTSAVVIPSAAPPAAPVTSGGGPSGCPHTGKWALCNVENRLRQSGFVAKRVSDKTVKRSGFSVAPAIYTLGRGHLEVFIYADSAALARDMAKIDTLTVAAPGAASSWAGNPILIRSENLAAVLVTENSSQIERLTLALTAGAPQPGSPR